MLPKHIVNSRNKKDHILFKKAAFGDSNALYQLAQRASKKGQTGFATLFLNYSLLNRIIQEKG